MEIRQLEYLVAVAEEANFTRAAERVHVSQSGVSAQVRSLERELGAELFDRSERVVRPTAAGTAALVHARRALQEVTALRRAVDDVNGVVRGHLDLGMLSGCSIGPWLDAVAAFSRTHPGVDLTLREDNSSDLVAAVERGRLDVALVAVAGQPPERLSSLVLVSEPPVALAGPDHDLPDPVPLEVLVRRPLVTLPAGTGIQGAFTAACRSHGVTPPTGLVASSPQAVARLSARGLGVGILSASSVPTGDGLRPVTITGADVPATVAVVWRPDRHAPTVAAFVEALTSTLAAGPTR